jgi:hypothetical protein
VLAHASAYGRPRDGFGNISHRLLHIEASVATCRKEEMPFKDRADAGCELAKAREL